MPVVSDNRPVESDNMPVESDNMPVESDNMPVDSDNMPVHCSSQTSFYFFFMPLITRIFWLVALLACPLFIWTDTSLYLLNSNSKKDKKCFIK